MALDNRQQMLIGIDGNFIINRGIPNPAMLAAITEIKK